MGCLILNEGVQNKILEYLENKAQPFTERDPYADDFKAKYSPATLINEWYEDRFTEEAPVQDDPLVSEYMDHYREKCQYTSPDRKDYFKMVFDGQGLGQELLMDHLGQSYYDNYITTYDLCYNHLVKGLCGPFPRKYVNGRYIPETDLSLIYGNLTQWGLREHVIPKPQAVCRPVPPVPEYTDEYKQYNMAEVKRMNDSPFYGKKKSCFETPHMKRS